MKRITQLLGKIRVYQDLCRNPEGPGLRYSGMLKNPLCLLPLTPHDDRENNTTTERALFIHDQPRPTTIADAAAGEGRQQGGGHEEGGGGLGCEKIGIKKARGGCVQRGELLGPQRR